MAGLQPSLIIRAVKPPFLYSQKARYEHNPLPYCRKPYSLVLRRHRAARHFILQEISTTPASQTETAERAPGAGAYKGTAGLPSKT